MDLAKEADYGHDLDVSEIFHSWEHDKGAFSQDLVRKINSYSSEFLKTIYDHKLKIAMIIG